MAKCRDCDDEILETEAMLSKPLEDLCQSCRLDRVLNDLMMLDNERRASVAREAMAYPGVAVHMVSRGDLVRITDGLLRDTKGLTDGN